MKHQSSQWIVTRLGFAPAPTLLYRFCCAIVLVSMVLSVGALLPLSASAQSIFNNSVLADNQRSLVTATATAQMPPSIVNCLRQALSKHTKIPAATLKVVETVPKTWADGCLGLARSGELCTQALVKGWRVVFSSGRQRWVYRTDQQGQLYRLEP